MRPLDRFARLLHCLIIGSLVFGSFPLAPASVAEAKSTATPTVTGTPLPSRVPCIPSGCTAKPLLAYKQIRILPTFSLALSPALLAG
jgi:hypothetical protein